MTVTKQADHSAYAHDIADLFVEVAHLITAAVLAHRLAEAQAAAGPAVMPTAEIQHRNVARLGVSA